MANFTKEDLAALYRMIGLPEETIEEAWQDVLRIRAEEAQKDGTTYHKQPNGDSETN